MQTIYRALIYFGLFLILANCLFTYSIWSQAFADFHIYLEAAKAISRYDNPYALEYAARSYIYPPFFGILVIPLVFISVNWANAIWISLECLSFYYLLKALYQFGIKRVRVKRESYACFLLISSLPFIIANIQEGQLGPMVYAILAYIIFHAMDSSRPILAGFLFALAIALKIQVICLIVPLTMLKKIKMLKITGVFLLGFLLLPFVIAIFLADFPQAMNWSLKLYTDYYSKVLEPLIFKAEVAGRVEYYLSNYSIDGVSARWFGQGVSLHPFVNLGFESPLLFLLPISLFKIIVASLKVILLVLSGSLVWKLRRDPKLSIWTMILFFLVVQLCSPTFWEHHLLSIILLFPLFYLSASSRRYRILAGLNFCSLFATCLFPFLVEQAGSFLGKNWGYLNLLTRLYGFPLISVCFSIFFAGFLVVKEAKSKEQLADAVC